MSCPNRLLGLTLLVASLGWLGVARAQEPARQARAASSWTVPSNEEIRELLAERMRHNGVGIVVGVIDGNGTRVVAHGRTGASDGRALDGNTVFQIGSLTKAFTTLLLAEMVERGEVALDDPASNCLPPGASLPERGRKITFRDLATHMSGLPSMPTNYDLEAEPDPYEAYSVEQLYQFLSTYSLEREPGTERAYSNLGVALLGRLLARCAGVEYETLIEQRVLEPLHLGSTSISLAEDQARRVAPGHDRYLEPVRTWEMATLPASGSLRSTANDMLTLLAAYLGCEDTPLASALTLQLGERLARDDGWQALGWSVRSDGIVLHSGGKQGYRSGVAFDPTTGAGAVVLANARTDDQPIDLAVHLVTGSPLPPAPRAPVRKRVMVDRALLDSYAGLYRLAPDRVLEVARKESHLLVHTPGGGVAEFHAMGIRDFFLITGNDEITFQVQDDGRVTGLILYGSGKDASDGRLAPRITS